MVKRLSNSETWLVSEGAPEATDRPPADFKWEGKGDVVVSAADKAKDCCDFEVGIPNSCGTCCCGGTAVKTLSKSEKWLVSEGAPVDEAMELLRDTDCFGFASPWSLVIR